MLGHSYTPTIYKELAELEYVRFEREPEDLAAFITGDEWEGTNVTIPYKRAVMEMCIRDRNFPLLKEVGKTKTPILLKRGMSGTVDELLMAAEYIMSEGNDNVILCERGIRTFETRTRNTFDLNAVPALHHLSHLPVVADPSHATGYRCV